jgi:hypothetical protein
VPHRNAAGVLLSDDNMWWWDGSRWHPATSATSGRPPRAPGSPWPWVIAAVLALLLVTALPVYLVWNRDGGGAGLARGYAKGFSQTYLQQRQSALADVGRKLDDLTSCERGKGPCYPAADTLREAADGEQGTVRTESGLFFFPDCLRDSANQEISALQQVHDASQALHVLEPSESQAVQAQLQRVSGALDAARSAVASSGC